MIGVDGRLSRVEPCGTVFRPTVGYKMACGPPHRNRQGRVARLHECPDLTQDDAMKNQSAGRPRPTEAELQILHILWARGECTVRDVYEILNHEAGVGYTTALKLLQVMYSKGLVSRDDSQRAHMYRAAVDKERTQKRFVQHILKRVFEGSPSQLVMHALGSRRASREELRQIRELLNKVDKESR